MLSSHGTLSRTRMWVSNPWVLLSSQRKRTVRVKRFRSTQPDAPRSSSKGSFAFPRKETRLVFLRFELTWSLLSGGPPAANSFSSSPLQLEIHLFLLSAFLNFLCGGGTDVLVSTEVYGRLRGTDRCGAGWPALLRSASDTLLCPSLLASPEPVARRAHGPPCVTYCRTQHSPASPDFLNFH